MERWPCQIVSLHSKLLERPAQNLSIGRFESVADLQANSQLALAASKVAAFVLPVGTFAANV
jgi:hypothetical protein